MSEPVSIELDLTGSGWADLLIAQGDERHRIANISYLSDALDDILRVGIEIATDRGFGMATFFHEPGSTILVAETIWWEDQQWNSGSRLGAIATATDFGDPTPTWRDVRGLKRDFLVHFASRDEMARALLDVAEKIEERIGVEGYSERWTGRLGFPVRAVAGLRAALGVKSIGIEPYG